MLKKKYSVKEHIAQKALINNKKYKELYKESIQNPKQFWKKAGLRIQWRKPYHKVKNTVFSSENVTIKWFEDGELNVCENCVDRHLEKRYQQTAILWEPDNPEEKSKKITYGELYKQVCQFANILKDLGVKKGDCIILYLPMIPEAIYAMLACARIGAVHSVVFAGFSPESLANRIIDCKAKYIITADQGRRGGKIIPLKQSVDKALKKCDQNLKCLTIRHTGASVPFNQNQDIWYHEILSQLMVQKDLSICDAETMNAEDPLFILYTSGSTGQPKGILHTSGGYLVYVSITFEYVFDYKEGDVFWCTADIGWITGHSYVVYGSLANGATVLMFEGVPNYPDPARFWQIIDQNKVNILYTAPTAIRSLMGAGDQYVTSTSRKSLKILGTVGEPINPEAWRWYYDIIGEKRCPIIDTWWQTETGGIMITPFPGATELKPGSATLPFFGIQPVLLEAKSGQIQYGAASGVLAIADSWPGQVRTIFGNHDRFIQTYFSQYEGYYFTGDGCRRDEDGCYWITGRVDDVINVSGHRLGTAEVESALVSHPWVSEAAVTGCPHKIKGQCLYTYITLMAGRSPSRALEEELIGCVRKEIGPVATPEYIQFVKELPKTRSGKIMRRILRKIAADDYKNLGDISTLADPEIVDSIIANRLNRHPR